MSEVSKFCIQYGVDFTASEIIVFKLRIFNYYFSVFLNHQIHLKRLLLAWVSYKIKLKQSNFERNAKKILGYEQSSSQMRDIEKICLLIFNAGLALIEI